MNQTDFTLEAYKDYLQAIKKGYSQILTFAELMAMPEQPAQFCCIRHDVDRRPQCALRMASLEAELGIRATYYFRAKSCSWDEVLVQEIALMGHEIGYHYENLSDTNGDFSLAYGDFVKNLENFRKVVPIETISMHGRPLKPYDNRDLWRTDEGQSRLKELSILGEVYLNIDYSSVAYVTDTGRNWSQSKSNRRDTVMSAVSASFTSGEELLRYLTDRPSDKLVFQIHPERWSADYLEHVAQFGRDSFINFAKLIASRVA
ncbi:MAG: hypothetical protein PHC51_01805 [bacterium]|nr:hypothetical protein [bacterium]